MVAVKTRMSSEFCYAHITVCRATLYTLYKLFTLFKLSTLFTLFSLWDEADMELCSVESPCDKCFNGYLHAAD